MKKRLLALALCLVMMVSLLPITAAAAYTPNDMMGWINGIKNNGIYCKEASFTINCPQDYSAPVFVSSGPIGSTTPLEPVDGQYKITAPSDPSDSIIVDIHFGNRTFSYIITIKSDHTWSVWTSNGDGTHSRTCSNGCVDSPQTEPCADTDEDHKCNSCNGCIHGWQFKAAGNKLTGNCLYCGKEVSVSLKADSVTLPKSPFNARLEGWEAFKQAVPEAEKDDQIVYKYKGPGDETFGNPIDPIDANAKAGQYQAAIMIKNLPEPVGNGPVAMADNQDSSGNAAELFVKYTAADPKVTAQTGDNRPIELMVGSVVVFSALAAAAFIADSKRRLQQ